MKAETSSLAEVRRFVEDVTTEAEIETEKAFDLKVAVSEACANAVEHTGSPEEDLPHRRLAHTRPADVRRDRHGPVQAALLPREAGESRGLGLPLMVALMDEVRFSRSPARRDHGQPVGGAERRDGPLLVRASGVPAVSASSSSQRAS